MHEMLVEQATDAEQETAAKVVRKNADSVVVPETSNDEGESESEAEECEEDPPQEDYRRTCVRGCSRVVSRRS